MKWGIMYLSIDIILMQIIVETQPIAHLNDVKMISMINMGSIEWNLNAIYS